MSQTVRLLLPNYKALFSALLDLITSYLLIVEENHGKNIIATRNMIVDKNTIVEDYLTTKDIAT